MGDIGTLLKKWDVPCGEAGIRDLEAFAALLTDWNTRMDLTSVPAQEMAARHFLDSLLPLREAALFPRGARLIDVGTGAGFPGLALAAARRDLQVTLLEAQGKRCQFLNAVRDALKLEKVTVIQDRAEVLGRAPGHRESYDLAVARAVAGLNVLCEYLLPFVRTGGFALCWKGPAVLEEMTDGRAAAQALGGRVETPLEMTCGDLEGRRLLVPVRKMEETSPQYPRKNGIPAKRPIQCAKS